MATARRQSVGVTGEGDTGDLGGEAAPRRGNLSYNLRPLQSPRQGLRDPAGTHQKSCSENQNPGCESQNSADNSHHKPNKASFNANEAKQDNPTTQCQSQNSNAISCRQSGALASQCNPEEESEQVHIQGEAQSLKHKVQESQESESLSSQHQESDQQSNGDPGQETTTTADTEKCDSMLAAVATGKLNIVQKHIQNGVALDCKGKLGRTALHIAVAKGHYGIAKLCIESGANVLEEDDFGETPLHLAVSRNSVNLASLLLDHGASTAHLSRADITPLHQGALQGHVAAMATLIKRGADVNTKVRKLCYFSRSLHETRQGETSHNTDS